MLLSIRTCLLTLGLGVGTSLLWGCSINTQGTWDESEQQADSSVDSPNDVKGPDSSDSGTDADVSIEADALIEADVSVESDVSVDGDASDSADLSVDADSSADSSDEPDVTIEADSLLDTIQGDTALDTNADSTVVDSDADSSDGADSSPDSGGQSDADAAVDTASDVVLDVAADVVSDALIESGPCVPGANLCDLDCDGAQSLNCGGTDCCDTDSRAFPGQASYFGEARKCGGFDFSCDGKETQRWTAQGDACKWCSLFGWCCADEGDYTDKPPVCGVAGRVAHCSNSVTCKNGDEQRTQECN